MGSVPKRAQQSFEVFRVWLHTCIIKRSDHTSKGNPLEKLMLPRRVRQRLLNVCRSRMALI
jgi:hypothetical protein